MLNKKQAIKQSNIKRAKDISVNRPLNGAKDRLIGLQPILSFFQPVTIYTMLNNNGPF